MKRSKTLVGSNSTGNLGYEGLMCVKLWQWVTESLRL